MKFETEAKKIVETFQKKFRKNLCTQACTHVCTQGANVRVRTQISALICPVSTHTNPYQLRIIRRFLLVTI